MAVLTTGLKSLNDNNGLDTILLLFLIQTRKVAVRLTTAATAEVWEAFRDRTGKAIIAAPKYTVQLTAAWSGSGGIYVTIHVALASQSRNGQHRSNGGSGDGDVVEMHFGEFEVVNDAGRE